MITLELAKVGLWGSQQDATPLSSEDLKEVCETFKDIGKAPVTLGHTLADYMPAFGWVKALRFDEEKGILYGDVELSDFLKEAVQENLYKSWSIGIKRRAKDGKRYLHHVAFLGEVPPKIKNLKVIKGDFVFSDSADEIWTKEFSEKLRLMSRAKLDWPIAPADTVWEVDEAKKRLFEKGVLDKCCAVLELREGEDKPSALSRYHFVYCDVIDGKVMIIPKAVSAGIGYLHRARGVKVREDIAKIALPVLEKLRKRIREKKEQEEKKMAEMEELKRKLSEYEKRFREAKKKELIEAAKGKIPQEKLSELSAFADSIPFDSECEFSDSDGSKKKKNILDMLIDLFKSIPLPVEPEKRTAIFGDNSRVNMNELMDRI